MSPEDLAAIHEDARRWAVKLPPPGPAVAARLRHLFNPPDLAERLDRLDADPAHAAEVAERERLRATPEYAAERKRLARLNAAGHHVDQLSDPPRRNRGRHTDPRPAEAATDA
jgi:hypothetical protein